MTGTGNQRQQIHTQGNDMILRLVVAAQATLSTLRQRLREERGAEAVQVALITAALVVLALLLIAAIRSRTLPAMDEISG